MYLLLFTIIYCIITQILNVSYLLALGIYLIGLCTIKGVLSEELKDVFNLKKTEYLYEKSGLKKSLMELLSLILVFLNSYLIVLQDYKPFTPVEFIFMFLVIAFVYRFLFWGITRTIMKNGQV